MNGNPGGISVCPTSQGLRTELRDVLDRAALGLEMHEIARELAIPQGTVATRLRLARQLFARAITRG